MQKMKKQDLRNGMRVNQRNGDKKIVMLDTIDGDIIFNQSNWGNFNSYNDDLTNKYNPTFDIVAVYKQPISPTSMMDIEQQGDLVWKNAEEMTMAQVCKELGREIKITT